MKAFITGFTGMVGSHLSDYLLEKTGWDIYGFSRWNDNFNNVEHLFPMINSKERVFLEYGDLNDFASLSNCISRVRRTIYFISLHKVTQKQASIHR